VRVSSNVLFADYAGTRACEKCHSDKVQTWLASPMHNMTREPTVADVKGPFDGTTFHFKDDTARLETKNGHASSRSSRRNSARARTKSRA